MEIDYEIIHMVILLPSADSFRKGCCRFQAKVCAGKLSKTGFLVSRPICYLFQPLARLGAFVIGVDPVEESSKIAQLHLEQDPAILPRIKYITGGYKTTLLHLEQDPAIIHRVKYIIGGFTVTSRTSSCYIIYGKIYNRWVQDYTVTSRTRSCYNS